jgi:internalin A
MTIRLSHFPALLGGFVLPLMLAFAAASPAAVAEESDGVVPDPAFRACLNGYLGAAADAPISADQLTSLASVDCRNSDIASIVGAEHLVNLWSLYLDGNQVSDLTPLVGLAAIQDLHLNGNQISDVTPLNNLVVTSHLYSLDLGGNQISDLTPLTSIASFTNLRGLYLDGNQILDLSPLDPIDRHVLYIKAGEQEAVWTAAPGTYPWPVVQLATDDSPLVLEVASGDGIASVDSAAHTVSFSGPGAAELAWTASRAYSNNEGSRDGEYFSGRLAVTVTEAPEESGNVVPDPAFRACLNGYLGAAADAPITADQLAPLTSVYCDKAGIVSIAGAEHLVNLNWLWLEGNQVSDLSPLDGLSGLYSLSFSDNQVSDLTPLAGLVNLNSLSFSDNQVSDLTPLANLTDLYNLSFNGNQVSDLTPLAGLSNLGWLFLDDNQVSDLTPLVNLANLHGLSLTGNHVLNLGSLDPIDRLAFYMEAWEQEAVWTVAPGTYPWPVVQLAADGSPLVLEVASGGGIASVDSAARTVSFSGPGAAELAWTASRAYSSDAWGSGDGEYFSGRLTVTVTEAAAPTPTLQPSESAAPTPSGSPQPTGSVAPTSSPQPSEPATAAPTPAASESADPEPSDSPQPSEPSNPTPAASGSAGPGPSGSPQPGEPTAPAASEPAGPEASASPQPSEPTTPDETGLPGTGAGVSPALAAWALLAFGLGLVCFGSGLLTSAYGRKR